MSQSKQKKTPLKDTPRSKPLSGSSPKTQDDSVDTLLGLLAGVVDAVTDGPDSNIESTLFDVFGD